MNRLWILALAAWGALVVACLFYQHPMAWPDEATFGDTAFSLAQGRGFATPSLTGQLPLASEHLVWVPPLHTLLVAAAFRLFGPSVEAMRVLSLAAAAAGIAAAYLLASRVAATLAPARAPIAGLLAVTILLVDARFLRVAIVGRMDMLTVALTLWAFCARGPLWRGLLAGLAMSAHPSGVIAAGAVALDAIAARAGIGAMARLAAGGAMGIAPWAIQVALYWRQFSEQIGPQFARMSVPESSIWRQITWNLDSRWLVALAIWLAIAAGIATLARLSRRSPAATAGARAVAIAGVLGLAVNLRRPEVMYAVWLIVPAAIGLAVAAAHPPARLARAAAAFVVLLVAGNAAYMTMRIVTTRALSYREFARSIRQCVVEPAPDGTLLLVDSLPEVYLSFIDARERLRIRLPSPTSGDRERRPLLEQLDAIFLGPLAHDPSWAFAIEAAREEWTVVPLREAGGYGGRLAMRRGREYAIPSSCAQHFYSAFRH